MEKKLFSILIVSLLAINYAFAGDIILADFDSIASDQYAMAKWDNGLRGIWQDNNIVIAYDTVQNPLTTGYNTSPYCMHVGQPANADWWGNFSGICIPGITASEDSMNGSGILVTQENHYLKVFILRNDNLIPFQCNVGTTEHPSNGMDYTSPGGTCPFIGGIPDVGTPVPDDKVGVWFDCIYDLTAIIGQHIRTVGFVNATNWNNPRVPTPEEDYYYDQIVLSDNPTPRDVVVPPLKASSDGFYIGFEDSMADAQWYSAITAQDPLSSYSIVNNTPDDVNQTTKIIEFNKSASAPAAQSGPLFTLNGAMPTSTNQYLHVFVKVPEGAIDTSTGYCDIQLIAKNWMVGDSLTENFQIFNPDVWQDVVLPITRPIGGVEYISNFCVLFDYRLNQFGKPTISPANKFYLDGIALNNDPTPRTNANVPDIVLADFDTTNPQPYTLAKWDNGNEGIWQGGSSSTCNTCPNIPVYDTIPNPLTDGYNTTPFCMRVGQVENADWWGNFTGIALPNITASSDSMNNNGILVTAENHYLKLFVLRDNNLVGFRVCVSTTEFPSNGMDYTSPQGNCPFEGEGSVPDDKVGVWFDCVYDLTPIIGQHIRTVGIINSENWNNPRIPTPATTFYYDNFVLSNNATPRDVVVPPLQLSSDGFYIGFEDSTLDAQWYSDVTVQDPLSAYSMVDNTPDDINQTTKVMEFDKSASAPAAQSGPLFTLNGAMPTSANQYLHVFVKVPEGALTDPNSGYCDVQLVARNWQVGDSVKADVPVYEADIWQDIVLPITRPIGGVEYISNFSILFDCRLNQFGRPTISPANTFYLDGIVLNNDPEPRTVLKDLTGINTVQISNLSAFNSSKNTVTVTNNTNATIKVFNSIGQTVTTGYVNANASQQFNVGQPGIFFIEATTGTNRKVVKVLVQ